MTGATVVAGQVDGFNGSNVGLSIGSGQVRGSAGLKGLLTGGAVVAGLAVVTGA